MNGLLKWSAEVEIMNAKLTQIHTTGVSMGFEQGDRPVRE